MFSHMISQLVLMVEPLKTESAFKRKFEIRLVAAHLLSHLQLLLVRDLNR